VLPAQLPLLLGLPLLPRPLRSYRTRHHLIRLPQLPCSSFRRTKPHTTSHSDLKGPLLVGEGALYGYGVV
jgi:hypothetical protein